MVAETGAAGRTSPERFYEAALGRAERAVLPLALELDGLDEEIALLRLLLREALQRRPEDLELMFRGIGLLTRAVAAKYRLSRQAEHDLAASLQEATRELYDAVSEPKAPVAAQDGPESGLQ